MKAELEFLTPALAKQLLEQNRINRKLRPRRVALYAADMKAGRWENNGETIIIAENGDLLNGQHRCVAVIQTGVTIPVFIVRGAPARVFKTMDGGLPRSTSDVLHTAGYSNTKLIAAIAGFAYFYASGARMDNQATKAELFDLVERHPYIVDASLVATSSRRFPKSSLGIVALMANEDRKYDFELAQFVSGIVYGENLSKGDPRHTLREWYSNRSGIKGIKVRPHMIHAATIRSWNAWVDGQALSMIRVSENFRRSGLALKGFNPALYADLPDLSEVSMAEAASAARSKGLVDRARAKREQSAIAVLGE